MSLRGARIADGIKSDSKSGNPSAPAHQRGVRGSNSLTLTRLIQITVSRRPGHTGQELGTATPQEFSNAQAGKCESGWYTDQQFLDDRLLLSNSKTLGEDNPRSPARHVHFSVDEDGIEPSPTGL